MPAQALKTLVGAGLLYAGARYLGYGPLVSVGCSLLFVAGTILESVLGLTIV